jgi:hypothetical protein
MLKIEPPEIKIVTGGITVGKAGVDTTMTGVAEEQLDYSTRPLPDLVVGSRNSSTTLSASSMKWQR